MFSTSEERTAEDNLLHGRLDLTMPEALNWQGRGNHRPVDSTPNVVVDRELITGQNPSSDHLIAAKLVEALDRTPRNRISTPMVGGAPTFVLRLPP